MKIALATPSYPRSLADGLRCVADYAQEAAAQGAEIICFPESYLPGYPLAEHPKATDAELQAALKQVCNIAAQHHISIVMPMDWYEGDQIFNLAYVISASGEVLGRQTKNQLDPSEDTFWTPGTDRNVFEINGLKFGITICHEGFRYPESVRWAARQGAHIVFHPNLTGSDTGGRTLAEWGHKDNPYYEKAQMMRALENTIYFAPCNYAFSYPQSASAVIAPDGTCIAHQPYGQAGVLVAEIDVSKATGLLAGRFKAHLYE